MDSISSKFESGAIGSKNMTPEPNKYKRYRDRLAAAGGRQISVFLPPEHRKKFDELKAETPQQTDVATIIKLIEGFFIY